MNRVRAVVLSLIVPAASLTPLLAAAQTLPDTPGAAHRPTILLPGKHNRTPPLVDLPPLPIENEQDETPHPPLPVRGGRAGGPHVSDPAIQVATPSVNAITPLAMFRWNRQSLGGPAAGYQWRRGSVALRSMGESFLRRLQQGGLRGVRAGKWQDALAGIRRRVRDAERRRSDRALRRGRGSLADVPVRASELSARPVLSVHRRVDDGQPARGVEPVLLHVHAN